MRVIVRRERPHPGAQLSLFEQRDGWRYEAFVTNTTAGQLAFLEARHRAHARVEDRIRHAKDSGLGRFPSRKFNINQTWLMITQIAGDLTAWTRLLGCSGSAAMLATCDRRRCATDSSTCPPDSLTAHADVALRSRGRGPGQPRSSRSSRTSPPSRNRPELAGAPPTSPPGEPQPDSASQPVVVPAVTPHTGALDHTAPTRSRPPS